MDLCMGRAVCEFSHVSISIKGLPRYGRAKLTRVGRPSEVLLFAVFVMPFRNEIK